ncbi:thermonuclease family protein [Mesorhizobium sp. WSM2239]|uniref:Thermonuclease family protein n=2 Tax=unclassified Mesorhizobium TaxID=325217 RepID=A0AAU8DIP2_9HYPH
MRRLALLPLLAIAAAPASAAEGYFDLQPGVTLESGDSWIDGGTRLRLYGVQACLRGTFYTDRFGFRRDCGEASLAVLAAYVADAKPRCARIARSRDTVLVSCFVVIGSDRLDLASLMISSGFAFASLDANGLPYHPAYAVVEQTAREKGAGLWQFDDVQHPAILLGQSAGQRRTAP